MDSTNPRRRHGLGDYDAHRRIREAAGRLSGILHRTPVLRSAVLDRETGFRCFLKAENLQVTGAFKVRGAVAAMSAMTSPRDIVTASAGNFGQGVAFGASHLGRRARVVVPEGTPRIKLRRIERFGGQIEVVGADFDEAYAAARVLGAEDGLEFLPPFDDLRVVEGQGTAALELLDEVPDLDALVLPCGGGGLVAGAALWAKAVNPRIKVVAVEPATLPSLGAALRAGRPLPVPRGKTFADGIAVREVGALPFQIIRRLVDGVVTVSEDDLAEAFRFLALEVKQVVEGAGAAAVAALRKDHEVFRGCRNVGAFLTGGNIDPETMALLLAEPALDLAA